LTRTAVLGLGIREDLAYLLEAGDAGNLDLSHAGRAVYDFLLRRGASFFSDIAAGVRHLQSEVEEALWQLVAAGLVTADSFAALRSLAGGENKRSRRSPRHRRQPHRTRTGRWWLLQPATSAPPGNDVSPAIENVEDRQEFWTHQYLRRYGILCRELLVRETAAPPWRELLAVLRRLEARGEIRGGRFLAGFHGEQFALPEAVEALRKLRRRESPGRFIRISACDPLNLVGILTPGSRVPAVLGNRIIYRDGIPAAAMESGVIRKISGIDEAEYPILERLLDERPASAFDPGRAAQPRQ
jgi:ATP-dependent Lhr-like helicase